MSINQALINLKDALFELNPTGVNGFEGLLAIILGKITGHEFRLAGSGSQHGKDGEAVSSSCHITFEGKLYTKDIPKNEVLGKATEIIGSAQCPDVWILGATVSIKTQILEPLQSAFEKNAISLLVLDWSETRIIPPLAYTCALAEIETIEFLSQNVHEKQKVEKVKDAITTIKQHRNYASVAEQLLYDLRKPTLGTPIAIEKNRQWLRKAFSDKKLARQFFGQSIAPLDSNTLKTIDREHQKNIINAVFNCVNSNIVALVGREGCGKSWLFAQSWIQCNKQPLSILIPASEIKSSTNYGQIEFFFIKKIIEQTGDNFTDYNKKKWERRFEQWRNHNEDSLPNLIVFIDGLNQNPIFEWGRWLDGANSTLKELSGVLVVSTRESFYNSHLKYSLYSKIEVIRVSEWTKLELKQILEYKQIELDDIDPTVIKTLQNPRILSIAFELLSKEQIIHFSELSVERLMFEHILIGTKDNHGTEKPDQFIARLSKHAQEIINRVKEKKTEDQLVFEIGTLNYNLSVDLLAVTQGLFYHPLQEDPTLYSLTDDGLNVALGLSIIKTLQKSERNSQNISDTLELLLEPITALDKTSEAVFSALLISSVDENCTINIQKALIMVFLSLQNIDTNYFPAFSSITRTATEASLIALFDLNNSNRYIANKDWLLEALRYQRKYPQCWNIIAKQIKQWLCLYSLAPKLSIISSRIGKDQDIIKSETEQKQHQIEKHLESLTLNEKTFLNENMIRDDKIDPSNISCDALIILTGMPLSEFCEAFVSLNFSQSLNSSHKASFQDFRHLIQHNQKDWAKTRKCLLRNSMIFKTNDASKIAKWALVKILQSTSTLDDAESAIEIYEKLTAGREKFPSWHLVEKYCPSDPCDPISSKPKEIVTTAEQYNNVDLSNCLISRGMSVQDLFLRQALPGVARFEGDIAVKVYRELINNIVKRDIDKYEIGLLYIESNAALLTQHMVENLLQKVLNLSEQYNQIADETQNYWFIIQYSLFIAFPHLDGDKQLLFLLSLPNPGPTLLQLTEVFKPVKPDILDNALDNILLNGNEEQKVTILSFASFSSTTISNHAKEVVSKFCTSSCTTVRALAFNIIAQSEDLSLLKEVAHGTWSANALDSKKQILEIWYGSLLIIEAGVKKIITSEEVIARISPSLFGKAVAEIGTSIHKIMADCLNKSIEKVLDIKLPLYPPLVEEHKNFANHSKPPFLSLLDSTNPLSPEDFFKRLSETPKEFDIRQKRSWDAFAKFEQTLTRENASFIIEDVGMEAIQTLLDCTPNQAIKWANIFLKLPEHKIRNIHNIALMLACVLSRDNPTLAKQLFEYIDGRRSFITVTSGLGKIPLEIMSIWKSTDNQEMNELWTKRLNRACTDHQIAIEVLAACINNKQDFLDWYANDLLNHVEPAKIARALMIYGFGEISDNTKAILNNFENTKGIIGTAAKAARFAYDRNCWSRHWFEQMCHTNVLEDFWRFSILFLKIVDARFELWERDIERIGLPSRNFEPSLKNKLQNRINDWVNKREKTLFGMKAPNRIFLLDE